MSMITSKIDVVPFLFRCHNWAELVVPILLHRPTPHIIFRNGVRFLAPDLHWREVAAIHLKHIYTPPPLPILREDIVVDIGANIGLFTIYAASRTNKTVYAFEPSPSTFACLQHNISTNELTNVILERLAVSDRQGKELLFESNNREIRRLERFAATVPEEALDVPENYLEVSTTTLQDIMDRNHIEQLDFLKVDCEGAEALILQSTPMHYLKRVKKIALEYHDHMTPTPHQKLHRLLREAGFIVRERHHFGPYGYLYGWRV